LGASEGATFSLCAAQGLDEGGVTQPDFEAQLVALRNQLAAAINNVAGTSLAPGNVLVVGVSGDTPEPFDITFSGSSGVNTAGRRVLLQGSALSLPLGLPVIVDGLGVHLDPRQLWQTCVNVSVSVAAGSCSDVRSIDAALAPLLSLPSLGLGSTSLPANLASFPQQFSSFDENGINVVLTSLAVGPTCNTGNDAIATGMA
jgi:hypothetical protein